jgi:hypothetical protein
VRLNVGADVFQRSAVLACLNLGIGLLVERGDREY